MLGAGVVHPEDRRDGRAAGAGTVGRGTPSLGAAPLGFTNVPRLKSSGRLQTSWPQAILYSSPRARHACGTRELPAARAGRLHEALAPPSPGRRDLSSHDRASRTQRNPDSCARRYLAPRIRRQAQAFTPQIRPVDARRAAWMEHLVTHAWVNGQWTAQTVSRERLMAQQKEYDDSVPTADQSPPAYGLLTRTLVRSPVVKQILPARIRSRERNDVVFVGVRIRPCSSDRRRDVC